MHYRLVFPVIILVLLVGSGCARTVQNAVEREVERKTGAEIETMGGATAEGIPAEFQYPGADVTQRIASNQDEGEAINVILTTNDSRETVEQYFDEEPRTSGWEETIKTQSDMAGAFSGTSYMFEKGDTQVSVLVSVQNDETLIALNLFKSLTQD